MIAVQSLLGFTPATSGTGEPRAGSFYWDPAMGMHRTVTTSTSNTAYETSQGAANAA